MTEEYGSAIYRCSDCDKEFGVWDALLRHYCPTLGYGGGD